MIKTLLAISFCSLSLFVSSLAAASAESELNLRSQADEYKQRYGLRNPDSKLVDNQGNGFDALYGVRNLRVVLHGVYYRGGANNVYNKNFKRGNQNPLQPTALENLCEEGFSEAVYLYEKNFASSPKSVSCKTRTGETRELKYSQLSALGGANDEAHLRKIYSHIKGQISGPVYEHCWNGWHASGYVAAITLKQFCGYSDAQTSDYWARNTDGNLKGMDSIRRRVRDWKPIKGLEISQHERDLICP